jgi:hypothetical protein
MYDWTEEYSRAPRTLHITEALETLNLSPDADIFLPASQTFGIRMLVTTDHYWQREHRSNGNTIELHPAPELRVLMVAQGTLQARVGQSDAEVYPVGSTVLIPAATVAQTMLKAVDAATVLEIGLVNGPQPSDRPMGLQR